MSKTEVVDTHKDKIEKKKEKSLTVSAQVKGCGCDS